MVDDLLSITTLKTDEDADRVYEITWSASDYDLEPYNAAVASPPGPYTMIRVSPNGLYRFPKVHRGMEIAGSWGYATSTPEPIREACVMLSARLWKRKDTVLGASATGDLGGLTIRTPEDRDILGMLEVFRRIAP
jgi:hypothetical protein